MSNNIVLELYNSNKNLNKELLLLKEDNKHKLNILENKMTILTENIETIKLQNQEILKILTELTLNPLKCISKNCIESKGKGKGKGKGKKGNCKDNQDNQEDNRNSDIDSNNINDKLKQLNLLLN
jgi:hypothetical protein